MRTNAMPHSYVMACHITKNDGHSEAMKLFSYHALPLLYCYYLCYKFRLYL